MNKITERIAIVGLLGIAALIVGGAIGLAAAKIDTPDFLVGLAGTALGAIGSRLMPRGSDDDAPAPVPPAAP